MRRVAAEDEVLVRFRTLNGAALFPIGELALGTDSMIRIASIALFVALAPSHAAFAEVKLPDGATVNGDLKETRDRLTAETNADQQASRMGVSLAVESGQLHFRADLGAGSLAVRL